MHSFFNIIVKVSKKEDKPNAAIGVFFQALISCLLFCMPIIFNGCNKKPEPPTIVHQFQDIAEMATVEYIVSKVIIVDDPPGWYKRGDRKMLLSCQARIKAGIDLSRVGEEHVNISGSAIRLEVPEARVITLSIDPESIREEFAQTGFFRSTFTNEERYNYLKQAEKEIRESLPEMGVLVSAENNTILFLESWLRLMGFEQVQIVVRRKNGNR